MGHSWDLWGSARRDAKRFPEPPDPPKKPKARKDTRRWCKGKEGRQHEPETIRIKDYWGSDVCAPFKWSDRWYCHHKIRCKNCKKILDSFLRERCQDYPKVTEENEQQPTKEEIK